jgi:hypothetical protein
VDKIESTGIQRKRVCKGALSEIRARFEHEKDL